MKTSLIAAGLTLAFGGAQALTLDFGSGPTAPAICSATSDGLGGLTTCNDGGFISQTYGDVAGVVDVSYSQPSNPSLGLRWWSTQYNDLYGVLWADGNDAASHARIELKPLGGSGITLTGFDFGAYASTTRGTLIDVYEIGGSTPLFQYAGNVGAGSNHTAFAVNVSSANGLWIDWRNSAYNVGIDNVTFNAQPVPEPGTWALMSGGMALLASAARRRRGR